MQFRIADTFTDSLAKLTGDEQKVVKTAAFDLQMNPAHPSLKLHQVDRAKDKDFWSVRVSRDIRLIVHRTASSFLLCYVDHHDAAYQWAERRRLERHPRTGAAQLVESEAGLVPLGGGYRVFGVQGDVLDSRGHSLLLNVSLREGEGSCCHGWDSSLRSE